MKHVSMTLAFVLCGIAVPALAQDDGISADKFIAARVAKAMAADTDKDGKLSPAEWAKGRANSKGDPARSFARTDANGDNFITADELKATARKRFDKLDTNSDGKLSHDELHPQSK